MVNSDLRRLGAESGVDYALRFVLGAPYPHDVIRAQAGIQFFSDAESADWNWIPACAAMTPGWGGNNDTRDAAGMAWGVAGMTRRAWRVRE